MSRLSLKEGEGLGRPVACQFSLYPMGTAEYMEIIAAAVEEVQSRGVYADMPAFVTRLEGTIAQVFDALEAAFYISIERAQHTVVVASFSCNSPTKRGNGSA